MALVFACFPLSALAQTKADAPQAPSCVLQELSSLDMSTDPDGRIAVPASVNGRPVRLIVDTGDIYATLASDIADELKLERRSAPTRMILVGNVMMGTQVDVDAFQLGRQQAKDFHFIVMPSGIMPANDDGLLGGSVFSNYDIEFDFARAKFKIFSQDHCPGQVVYWTKSAYGAVAMHLDEAWHITVPVTLNGKVVTAVVDSGAANSVMPLEVAKDVLGIDISDPAMKKIGIRSINGGPAVQVYRYPFSTLTLQDVTVNNPEIDLVPQAAFFRRGGPQLLLGIGVLRQLHIYVAYGEQVLYVTPAETP
jgi:predicted aspartyl protease